MAAEPHEEGIPTVKRLLALIAATALVLGIASPVFADQPPGQLGYEGQPGNQGGGGGNTTNNNGPPGNLGN